MTAKEFEEPFRGIAILSLQNESVILQRMKVYYDHLKYFEAEDFREVCFDLCDNDPDINNKIPTPEKFKFLCFQKQKQTREKANIERRDPMYGRRPQDIKARTDFYNKLAETNNTVGARFSTSESCKSGWSNIAMCGGLVAKNKFEWVNRMLDKIDKGEM